jgi:hypothetical protein
MIMLSVNQMWDPLEVCIVGKMYDPGYFKIVPNVKIRNVLEKIAMECEEDFQRLIRLLEDFNVEVIRPNAVTDKHFIPPPVTPRDHTAMIGNRFFIDPRLEMDFYQPIVDYVTAKNGVVHWKKNINTATIRPLGRDLLCGQVDLAENNVWTTIRKDNWPQLAPKEIPTNLNTMMIKNYKADIEETFKGYRCHYYEDDSHLDGRIFIGAPGLLITNKEIDHGDRFKDWDILYFNRTIKDEISNNRFYKMVQKKNRGRWWVPGEESNNDFADFVDCYLSNWVGFIEESQFDLNILMIDESNAVCTNANDEICKKLDSYGIKLHVVNFRHSLFFDGGIHCITSDIKRRGALIDLTLLGKGILL